MAESLKKRSGVGGCVSTEHSSIWVGTTSNPSGSIVGYGDYPYMTTEKEFVGFDVPNFHRRRRGGELLPHTPWKSYAFNGNATGTYSVKTGTPSSWSWTKIEPTFTMGAWRVTKEIIDTMAPDMSDKYVQEAAASIYSQGFDALTFVAELGDVRSLFTDIAGKILRARVPLKLPKGIKVWKDLSCEYLSVRYGWRPLLSDIKNLYELVTTWNEVGRTRHSARQYGISSEQTSSNELTTISGNYYKVRHVYSYKTTTKMVGSVTADIEIPKLQFNPFVTGWELIPFSFVVDWYLSIGKAISAASFLAFNSKYAASSGFKVTHERVYDMTIEDLASSTLYADIWCHGECKGELEVRTPCSVPLTPHLKLNINPYKILDMLGMIVQKLPRDLLKSSRKAKGRR